MAGLLGVRPWVIGGSGQGTCAQGPLGASVCGRAPRPRPWPVLISEMHGEVGYQPSRSKNPGSYLPLCLQRRGVCQTTFISQSLIHSLIYY